MQEQYALLWKLFTRGVTPSTLDVWQEELMSIQLLQIPQSTISNTVSPRRHYRKKDSTAIRNRNVKPIHDRGRCRYIRNLKMSQKAQDYQNQCDSSQTFENKSK